MLTAILHRRRQAANRAAAGAAQSLAQNRRIYGTRLLVRGLLWVSVYLLSRGLLELDLPQAWLRVAVSLLPAPIFIWYLVTWMKGVAAMDELQRRVELEALGFAFPAALVYLMTVGLLDLAVALPDAGFSLHYIWVMLPLLYYIGLVRAKRRYA